MTAKTSSSSKLEATCYLKALKAILKNRGITYSDLAGSLQCSLTTIKRALNKTSMPLNRLLEIAEVAGVTLADICQRAEQLRPQHMVFTERQDRLFAERGELLAYFVELSTTGANPREIAKKHDLDARSTATYLRHLEQVGLIKRNARNQVKLLVSPPFGFAAGGPYLKTQFKAFLTAIVSSTVDADPPDPRCTTILKPLALTEEDHSQMIGEMIKLIDRFAAISERRISDEAASLWQIAVACGPGPDHQSICLPRISN